MSIRLALIITLLVFNIWVSETSWAGEKPKVLIKIATLAPKNSALARVIQKGDQELRKLSNNQVGYRIYYGGIQGDELEVIQKMKFNQLQGGILSVFGLHRIVSDVHVLSIPYMFKNYDEANYVRDQLKNELETKFLKKGYVILNWGDNGFVYQFSKVPIDSLESARDQKFWQWGDDPVSMEIYKVLGVTPVSLSANDVMTSLSSRLIDAAGTTPALAVSLRWYTKFKYMSEYPSVCVQGATIVRKDAWEKIPKEAQDRIKGLSQKNYDEFINYQRKEEKLAVEHLLKSGIQVLTFDEDERELQFAFNKYISKKVRKALVGKLYSKELLAKAEAALEEFRKKQGDNKMEKIQVRR